MVEARSCRIFCASASSAGSITLMSCTPPQRHLSATYLNLLDNFKYPIDAGLTGGANCCKAISQGIRALDVLHTPPETPFSNAGGFEFRCASLRQDGLLSATRMPTLTHFTRRPHTIHIMVCGGTRCPQALLPTPFRIVTRVSGVRCTFGPLRV